MSTHQVLCVSPSWRRTKTGGLPSPLNRSCWESRSCWMSQISKTQPKQRLIQFTVRTGWTMRNVCGRRPRSLPPHREERWTLSCLSNKRQAAPEGPLQQLSDLSITQLRGWQTNLFLPFFLKQLIFYKSTLLYAFKYSWSWNCAVYMKPAIWNSCKIHIYSDDRSAGILTCVSIKASDATCTAQTVKFHVKATLCNVVMVKVGAFSFNFLFKGVTEDVIDDWQTNDW